MYCTTPCQADLFENVTGDIDIESFEHALMKQQHRKKQDQKSDWKGEPANPGNNLEIPSAAVFTALLHCRSISKASIGIVTARIELGN